MNRAWFFACSLVLCDPLYTVTLILHPCLPFGSPRSAIFFFSFFITYGPIYDRQTMDATIRTITLTPTPAFLRQMDRQMGLCRYNLNCVLISSPLYCRPD